MPLAAMQRNGIRLQQAGKKIGRERHPARRNDDRRMSSNGSRRSVCPSALQVMNPRSRPRIAPC